MKKNKVMPRYPIYVPSKGRYEKNLTANFLIKDGIPFKLVIEKEEYDRENPVLTKSIKSPILQKADDLTAAGTPNAFFVALNNTIDEHRLNLKLEEQEVNDGDTT